jgi:hypothetical protein
MQNWLQQQGGRSATFLVENFAVLGSAAYLTLGVVNAGLTASDDGSVATFHFDGSNAGLTARVRMDELQTPLAYIGGPPGNAATLQLSSGTQGGSDARVLVVAPQGGTAASAVRADALLPTRSQANMVAAGFPRDAGVYGANFVKAVGRVRLQRTGGALSPVNNLAGINVGNATYTGSGPLLIPVVDRAAGLIAGIPVVSVTQVALGGSEGYPVAAEATYNAGTGNIEVVVNGLNTSTNLWYGLHVPTGTSGLGDVEVRIEVTLY